MKNLLLILLSIIPLLSSGQGQYNVAIGEICKDSINDFGSFQWCVDFECPELQQYPELIKYLHHIENLELHKYHGDSTVFILTRKIITKEIASILKRNTFRKNLLSGWQDTTAVTPLPDSLLWDRVEYPPIQEKVYLIITDQLLFEYETDCYNDSSEVWVEVPYAIKPGLYPSGYRHMDLLWIHKQPTFPDFINWLKKSEQ